MGATFCLYEKDTLYIVRVLGKERCRETWRVGEEMCACPRDKVIGDLYWGPDFRREGGGNVRVCWCWGKRMTFLGVCVCGCGGGGGLTSDKE